MNSSTQKSETGANKLKLYAIGAGVLLLFCAISYFVGLQAGKAQLATQKATYDGQIAGLNTQLRDSQSVLEASRSRASLMEARGALYRTTTDLDLRNFGTANGHLNEAATALNRVKAPDVSALAAEIKGTDLNVAVNLSDQRAKVLGFAAQLNKVIPVEIENTTPIASADVAPAAP